MHVDGPQVTNKRGEDVRKASAVHEHVVSSTEPLSYFFSERRWAGAKATAILHSLVFHGSFVVIFVLTRPTGSHISGTGPISIRTEKECQEPGLERSTVGSVKVLAHSRRIVLCDIYLRRPQKERICVFGIAAEPRAKGAAQSEDAAGMTSMTERSVT